MLVTTVFRDSTQTKNLPCEAWDAEDLLKSFKILKVIDSSSSIPGHELAFKVGICSAVQCYLGEGCWSRLFNQLFVTSSDMDGHIYTYLVCSSSLLPILFAINGLPLEIKWGEQTLKASTSKIYLEEEQVDHFLSLAPEASEGDRNRKAQSSFQRLFEILPDGLKLDGDDIRVSTSALTLMAKIKENPERLEVVKRAIALAKKIGDSNLYCKALATASEISDYPNLFGIRREPAGIEQVRQKIVQRIAAPIRTSLDEQFSSASRTRSSFWLAGTPVYEPTGGFSHNESPESQNPSDLVTPCMQCVQLRGSHDDLDIEGAVPMEFSVHQINLQKAKTPASPVFMGESL